MSSWNEDKKQDDKAEKEDKLEEDYYTLFNIPRDVFISNFSRINILLFNLVNLRQLIKK
jgi:hypothetical protein